MSTNEFDFCYDTQGVERNAVLTEAAERLDLLHGHLGPDGKVEPSEEGNIARDAMDKEAKLAAFPDVYKITDQDYLARRWKESRTLHLAAVLNCV